MEPRPLKRERFLELAGGVFESLVSYNGLSKADKFHYFWGFYVQKDLTSIYGKVPVETLIDSGVATIEHILPKSALSKLLRREAREVRNGSQVNPFNFAPAHKQLNSFRSSFPFDVDEDRVVKKARIGKPNQHFQDLGLDAEHEWVLPADVRGTIARSLMYMSLCYDLRIWSLNEVRAFRLWMLEQPPQSWERDYDQWVDDRWQIRNPFNDRCDIPAKDLLTNERLFQRLIARKSKKRHKKRKR